MVVLKTAKFGSLLTKSVPLLKSSIEISKVCSLNDESFAPLKLRDVGIVFWKYLEKLQKAPWKSNAKSIKMSLVDCLGSLCFLGLFVYLYSLKTSKELIHTMSNFSSWFPTFSRWLPIFSRWLPIFSRWLPIFSRFFQFFQDFSNFFKIFPIFWVAPTRFWPRVLLQAPQTC